MIKDNNGMYKKADQENEKVKNIVKGLLGDFCKFGLIVLTVLLLLLPWIALLWNPIDATIKKFSDGIGAIKGEPRNCPIIEYKCPEPVCDKICAELKITDSDILRITNSVNKGETKCVDDMHCPSCPVCDVCKGTISEEETKRCSICLPCSQCLNKT